MSGVREPIQSSMPTTTLDNPLLQPALTPDEAVRLAWAVVQIVPVRRIP
jgi:hypothetical protein